MHFVSGLKYQVSLAIIITYPVLFRSSNGQSGMSLIILNEKQIPIHLLDQIFQNGVCGKNLVPTALATGGFETDFVWLNQTFSCNGSGGSGTRWEPSVGPAEKKKSYGVCDWFKCQILGGPKASVSSSGLWIK